ncbi:MAG: DMT family transporter [Chloroflexi bacterium]|nr:MAG: DMT family transporter [Chloroflexota bacterium]
MLAVVAGLGAATAWAASTLASTRASRLIGAASTVGWVTAVGLPLAVAAAVADRNGVSATALPWLAIAGLGNVAGLLLAYRALRIGPVSVVAPLVSMEGAVAALLSMATGSSISAVLLSALGLVVAGGALTATAATDTDVQRQPPRFNARDTRLAAMLAVIAAVLFGASLYATAQIGRSLPIGWAVLAPRVTGAALVAMPLAIRRRLVLTWRAAPLVVVAGVAEVIGFACIGLGSRSDVAITAVLASQFAVIAVIGAVLVFGERLGWKQRIGIAAVAVGTALVAALKG